MAEILVRVSPHTFMNGVVADGRLNRGEVVSIGEDGHLWSHAERNNPAWMIVTIPGITAESLSRLLSKYTDEEIALIKSGVWNGNLVSDRRRAWRLNIDNVQALLADNVKTAEFLATPTWEKAEMLRLVERWDEH